MIPFDYQCPKHKKRDLMKEFEPELGALTSYLLSIPSERIEAVLKGLGSSNLNSTVWESQMRSDGLAAWLNDWVVQDSTASVRIGSNSKEWMSEEDYDATRSTLYGSYALYCRQTNLSAKSPQKFSAELLELGTSIVGWSMEKDRVKIVLFSLESSRLQLTDAELIEFNKYLKNKVFKLGDNSYVPKSNKLEC